MTTQTSGLGEKTIAVVKSTAPVLARNGELLTRHFYERMFRENPEVKPLFNAASQAAGTQQRALAGAICAFAANVDNLDVLAGAVERIAQKHAGLGILPEHYPIVGSNLLASIREVLGEAATDEIIDAWAEAYGFLADILIGREKDLYDQQEQAEHGWRGFRQFRVARIVRESSVISSFFLQPADGGGVPVWKPGQYLTVRVPDATSGTTMRNYSISSAPGSGVFRISVKAEPSGTVSGWLHSLTPGAEIEVGPPCGEFFLDLEGDRSRPLVLLSAGVGITPLLSMLEAAVVHQPERQVFFVHGALDGSAHAFREHVRSLASQHPQLTVHFRYSDPAPGDASSGWCDSTGMIDASLLESLLPSKDCEFHFCGPKPFMGAILRQLSAWEVPAAQIHYEFFGPHQELAAAGTEVTNPEPPCCNVCQGDSSASMRG